MISQKPSLLCLSCIPVEPIRVGSKKKRIKEDDVVSDFFLNLQSSINDNAQDL